MVRRTAIQERKVQSNEVLGGGRPKELSIELNSESEVPDVYTRWTLTLRKETHTKRQARTWKVRFFFQKKV